MKKLYLKKKKKEAKSVYNTSSVLISRKRINRKRNQCSYMSVVVTKTNNI